jgi:beta-ureidopropionase / N-carbamoyl-L-amino-acid hydrolase
MTASIDPGRLLRDLDGLARIGATASGGVTRVAYSEADLEGRRLVEGWLREAGCAVERDAAGNTLALYPGSDPSLAPLAAGSHTDTVPEGGRFDGALGVVAAVACVRALGEAGERLRHPLAILNFACEEATLSGGTLGSRALAGDWDPAILAQPAWDGRPVEEHLRAAGLDPAGIANARREPGAFAAYLELHVEQGGRLEAEGIPVAAVEGIVGIRRYAAVFEGVANHAGTTPMDLRSDALVAAAPFVGDVRETALRHGIVGTVGTLAVQPGASNVIPGRVELTCEIRSLEEAALDAAEGELAERARARGGRLGRLSAKAPVRSSSRLVAAVEAAAARLGLSCRRLPSGAGHDAMCVAALSEVAMVFVPSRGGVSHSPLELTEPEDCVNGARVLLEAIRSLD